MTRFATRAVVGLAIAVALSPAPVTAQTPTQSGIADQVITSLLGEGTSQAGCTPTVKTSLSKAIRQGIETEVKRREKLLQNPMTAGALGCLDQLMSANLDFAIALPSLNGLFQKAASQLMQQACQIANEKLQELTAPIKEALTLPDLGQLLNVSGMTGGIGSNTINMGSIDLKVGSPRTFQAPSSGYDANADSLTSKMLQELYGIGGTR